MNRAEAFHQRINQRINTSNSIQQRVNEAWDNIPVDQVALDQFNATGNLGVAHQEQFIAPILKDLPISVARMKPFFELQNRYRYFFSRNIRMEIPFPGSYPSGRYNARYLESGQLDIDYFGREMWFPTLFDKFNNSLASTQCLQVIGNLGSGKSHVLTALALSLHLIHADLENSLNSGAYIDNSNFLRVVYVPSWQKGSLNGNFKVYLMILKDAVQFAFPDEDIRNYDAEALKKYLFDKASRSIVFILDDWNRILSYSHIVDSNEYKLHSLLTEACSEQLFVYGISASSTTLTSQSSNAIPIVTMQMYGGLTNTDWQVWQQHAPFNVFQSMTNQEEINNFAYYTGLVPYFLKRLTEYGDVYRIEAWSEDSNPGGGDWILNQLIAFSREKLRPAQVPKYIELMLNVVSGDGSRVPSDMYNHQFFSLTSQTPSKIVPICGFVSVALLRALRELNRIEFEAGITRDWVNTGLNHSDLNPSMKGFLFESYCLHHIKQLLKAAFSERKGFENAINRAEIVFFDGDYPPASAIQDNRIFWPRKWNFRYVNMILRLITKEDDQNVLNLLAVQVTLQHPENHEQSLEFFNPNNQHRGKSDYERYLDDEDFNEYLKSDIRFELVWLLPSTLQNPRHRGFAVPSLFGRSLAGSIRKKQIIPSSRIIKVHV